MANFIYHRNFYQTKFCALWHGTPEKGEPWRNGKVVVL